MGNVGKFVGNVGKNVGNVGFVGGFVGFVGRFVGFVGSQKKKCGMAFGPSQKHVNVSRAFVSGISENSRKTRF